MATRTLMISIRNRNLTFRNHNSPKDPTTTLIKVKADEGEIGSMNIPESLMKHAIVIADFTTQTVLLNKSANFIGKGKERIVVEDGKPLPKLPAKYLKQFGEAFKRQSFTKVLSMDYLVDNIIDDGAVVDGCH